jgi:hypothetical protein
MTSLAKRMTLAWGFHWPWKGFPPPCEENDPCMGFHWPWKVFPPISIVDMVKGLLMNPPYNMNGVEVDDMLAY